MTRIETAKQFTWENAVARREQILLDIHHERVGYDRFSPAKIGLVDGLGVEFECAPADVSGSAPGLLWRAGSLYLVEGGVKRHITNPSLITPLVERDYRYIDSDSLSFRSHAGRFSDCVTGRSAACAGGWPHHSDFRQRRCAWQGGVFRRVLATLENRNYSGTVGTSI